MPTVLHRLAKWAEETPESAAQRFKKGGEWHTITAREFRDHVYYLALYLESKGVTKDHVSAILATNSPEWVQLELGMLLLSAKSAGLYPNSTAADIHYVLAHTEAKVLGVQNAEYFKKITSAQITKIPASIDIIIDAGIFVI